METPYLLSNLTTVLQGIENVFYFIVPKTKEVLHDLKNRQDSVTISFGNVTADVRNLQGKIGFSDGRLWILALASAVG